MSSFRSIISHLLSILLFYLGCFTFTCHPTQSKKRKLSPLPFPASSRLKLSPSGAASSSWSFIKRIFSHKLKTTTSPTQGNPISVPSPPPSTKSLTQLIVIPLIPSDTLLSVPLVQRPVLESDIYYSDQEFLGRLRNDIHPCTVCGEIFPKSYLLERHETIQHAVSKLNDGDTGKNIVTIIFQTGWPERVKDPIIHRVLRIHNSSKILTRFEEHREWVMSKAAAYGGVRRREERCLADGNELLRFHCTTFMCELGQSGNSTLCSSQYCSVCGIIKSGFSVKLDGISTLSSGWRAHVAIPEDTEEDFKFMNVKRAMILCRVIAGRVGRAGDLPDDKLDPGFDSLMGGMGGGIHGILDDEEELMVLDPRAVLPCFAIVYTV